MSNGSATPPISSPSTSKRLDVAFPWTVNQPLAKDLRRFSSTLETRFTRSEDKLATIEDMEAVVLAEAQATLAEILGPSINKILKLAEHGFLVRSSTFEFEPILGAQQIFVIIDDDIDVFMPTAFVTFTREGSPDDWAIMRTLTWNPNTGELGVETLSTFGDMGPHSDWIVSATAAEAPFMAAKAAEIAEHQDEVLAASVATTANAAATSADRSAVASDRSTVSGYVGQASTAALTAATEADRASAEADRAEAATVALDPTALQAQIDTINSTKAPKASPALTGAPTAPTATFGDNSTLIATTAFVAAVRSALLDGVAAPGNTLAKLYALNSGFQSQIDTLSTQKAPKASPVFSGDVTVGTIAPGDNSTKAASTAFVTAADIAANASEAALRDTAISAAIATEVTNRNAAIVADATHETKGENAGVNTQTGTAYTLLLTDKGKSVEMNNAAVNTVTIPPNSSVAFPVKSWLNIVMYGAGQTSIVAGAGVTIRSAAGNLKIGHQYGMATIYKRATDEWVLVGDLKA